MKNYINFGFKGKYNWMNEIESKKSERPTPITRNDLSTACWGHTVTLRHGQCDPAGIAYTPHFFDLFNVAVEDWYSTCLGISYYEIIGSRRIGLGYAKASANFFEPCLMGDQLEIFVIIDKIGNSSLSLDLHIFKEEVEKLRGKFVTVATDLDTHKAIKIPQDILDALILYKSNCD